VRSNNGKVSKNGNNSEEMMNIRKTAPFALIIGAIIAGTVNAQKPKTFDRAKALSTQQNKPLLLEFFREG